MGKKHYEHIIETISKTKKFFSGLLYTEDFGDLLYVLSNGSLLKVSNDWKDYKVFNEYCIDKARYNGKDHLFAVTCHDVYEGVIHISKIEANIFATCKY